MTRLALALLLAGAAACSIDRRTDSLACTTSATCAAGRVCDHGYCVAGMIDSGGGSADALTCPSACTSCDSAAKKCTIVGNLTGSVQCPAGWNCAVDCTGTGACGTIDCRSALSCTVSCVGQDACGSITGGTGALDATCTGSAACGSISCSSSCRCDVTCPTGDCGTNTCPMVGAQSCASGSPAVCDSTVKQACHQCP